MYLTEFYKLSLSSKKKPKQNKKNQTKPFNRMKLCNYVCLKGWGPGINSSQSYSNVGKIQLSKQLLHSSIIFGGCRYFILSLNSILSQEMTMCNMEALVSYPKEKL